jgi:hypothetical protein
LIHEIKFVYSNEASVNAEAFLFSEVVKDLMWVEIYFAAGCGSGNVWA